MTRAVNLETPERVADCYGGFEEGEIVHSLEPVICWFDYRTRDDRYVFTNAHIVEGRVIKFGISGRFWVEASNCPPGKTGKIIEYAGRYRWGRGPMPRASGRAVQI